MKICLLCEGVASTDAPACASCGTRLLRTDEVHFPVRRGEDDAAHPLLGTLVDGKYRVAGVLGRGGMGAVFRATHEVSLVPIALKLLHPRLAGRVEYRAQFLAEARKAGRVVHDHTARVLDVGETQDGSIYIAQELVTGSTLHEWLLGPALRPEVVVEILRQVCAALAAAHAVGLVHRDLTPRNIMVDVRHGRPHAKVLDFGIARGGLERAPGGGEDGLAAFASPPYAAPEHLAGLDVDGRADLYGLGVIAYEALCGRIPTAGSSAREFAAATVRGELLPLTPRARVPRRLLRLIQRLLARDPEHRPASAGEVLAELDAIAAPNRGKVRALSVAALLLVVFAGVLASRSKGAQPFLRLAPEQGLELLPVMPRGVAVTPLRSADLSPLQFDFGAFEPERLTIEVWQPGEVERHPMQPRVQGGTLTLDVGQAPYARLLNEIRGYSRQGPVYLKFVVPGAPPLAYAALRIDDQPPIVALAVQDAGPDGALTEASGLRIDVEDENLDVLVLEVEHGGNRHTVPLRPVSTFASGLEILGALFPPPRAAHGVQLRLLARDAAGNEARAEPVICPTVDLGAPRVVRVVGARAEARTLLVGSGGVRLRIELADKEAGLSVAFGRLGAPPEPCSDLVETGPGLDVTWPRHAGDPSPPDDRYEVVVRDRAGNETRFTDTYAFVHERLDPALTVLPPDALAETMERAGRAVFATGGILWDGLPVALGFSCNPLYRPTDAVVATTEAGEPQPLACRLGQARDGGAVLVLAALRDGRYRLTVQTRAALGGDEQRAEYDLLVRREPVLLRVPGLGAKRFLPQLVELGALAWQDGVLGDGRAWSLEPPDVRWLRGTVWSGRPPPTPHALPVRTAAHGPLLPPLQPMPGENVLGVSLRDALDRPVRVFCGEQPAALLSGAGDGESQRVVELLRFYWHDELPRARTSEVHVEYGQPARFVVDAPLPYSASDSLDLYVDTFPCRPKSVQPARDGGSTLEFELPFERLQALARLGDLGPEQFAENRVSEPFTLWLSAPDGRHAFSVRARTSRSILEPLRLVDLARTDSLPASSRGVCMVPILGPGLGRSWRDPVPAAAEDRPAFRPNPSVDVRGVEDFYLQQHEATCAQYADVVDALVEWQARQEALPVAELVHHGDPYGAARLRAENLVPRVYRGDARAFAAAVRAGPDRPIAGLDFFQAHVFARATGWLLAREPDLFRLPTGVELELAALGAAHQTDERDLLLNGAARAGGVRVAAAHAAAVGRREHARWPLTALELVQAGDVVTTELGAQVTGLDFGVREWVADLPRVANDRARAFDASADHVRHLEATEELASGQLPDESARQLLRFAIARGCALDELVHAPQAGTVHGDGRWPARVPGVVRVLQLARDGSGVLPGEFDPHLPAIGVRLCGGRRFLEWVRAR